MNDDTLFRVGQVWERDGRQREIVKIEDSVFGLVDCATALSRYDIWWKRPSGKEPEWGTWCTTWNNWASKATLVKDAQ